MGKLPSVAIVTRETRMEGLLKRRPTKGALGFSLNAAMDIGAVARKRRQEQRTWELEDAVLCDIQGLAVMEAYEEEATVYEKNVRRIRNDLNRMDYPIAMVNRELLSTYDFGRCMAVVVVGQDGLVANTAKYAQGIPIIGVNGDPEQNEGRLLPFLANEAQLGIARVAQHRAKIQDITLASVELTNGQSMLAFNDFFIGYQSHQSARYILQARGKAEQQISSGVIVSTGAGSTGWLSSVYNMTCGVAQRYGSTFAAPPAMAWDEPRLKWAVREPFRTKQTGVDLVVGEIESNDEIIIESLMPNDGVIFSDGIERDYLEFNSGTAAHISVAKERAQLVLR